jgi:iron complex transport system ATP-binding protein
MDPERSITISGVDLGYHKSGQEIRILKNVQLDFSPGDFIGIVGLNGVGKSTLLKGICGLLPTLKGQILLNGKDLSRLSLEEVSKQVSVVLTEKVNGFNLTTYDLVAAGQMPYTNSFHQLKEEHKKIIEAAIEACGIREHQDKGLNELSDGLFQKASIARAIAQQTPTILLDEPSAFLDYASKHKLFILLKQLAMDERKTILVSSHDLELVMKYCSRIVIIQPNLIELVSITDAKNNAAFRELGGGYL